MKLEFIPKVITLFAGAVVCLVTIINGVDTEYSLELLLGTLVIFYIIGLIAKAIITKVVAGNMFVKRHDAMERTASVSEMQNGNGVANADMGHE